MQAIEYRASGQYEEARRILVDLLTLAPDDAQLHYHMAWTHDATGEESGAVPFYERALELGLSGAALLGLGSTYRALGAYDRAMALLERGLAAFPDGHEFAVFLAMALYNTREHERAMQLLLHTLAETTADPHLLRFRRAIQFYANRLNETWT